MVHAIDTSGRAVLFAGGTVVISLLGLFVAWQLFPKLARPLVSILIALVHPHDRYF